ncbi:MAG: SDR family oxidoreductase [Acidobacteria bacterium]|nr:SDR family oxidoreductase [Acidobacteriota bacterium]
MGNMGAGKKMSLVLAGVAAGAMVRAAVRHRRAIDLHGKVVLITGGSRGLGFAMAEEFAWEGARALVICARNQEGLDRASAELSRQGPEVVAVRCDVSDRAQVAFMIEEATRRFGGIDVLVNNAGIISVGPVEEQRFEDFEEAMNVMFWGVVNATLMVLPQMIERGDGHIVNITSIGARFPMPHLLAYESAKFAAVGFSEGLRAEVARHGIHVLTVCPGLMRTGSYLNAYFKGKHREEFSWFSLGSTLPLVSIDGRRAAAKIVRALRTGVSDLVITPQAKLAAAAHGVAPGLVSEALGIVARLLPDAGGAGPRRFTGKESETAVSRSFLTTLGREAAEDLLQV